MFGAGRLNTLAAAMAASGSTYVSASGGTVSYGSQSGVYYKAHTFTSTGSFVVSTGGTVDSLIVGGGGPGGAGGTYRTGGGGGGGRVQLITDTTVTPQTYSITVGAAQTLANTVGNSSSAFSITSVGGGAGGSTSTGQAGGLAGGGGGSANTSGLTESAGGSGTNAGGAGRINSANYRGGGGGGGSNTAAGSNAGGTANNATGDGGNGANGYTWAFDGLTYGGGGGGAGSISAGSGGTGGGGAGNGTAGTANTGGGGGGTNSGGTPAAVPAGGSGVVKIRYAIDPTVFQFIEYISTAVSGSTTITIPTIQAGDLVFFFNSASSLTTAPTAIAPSGWTAIGNTSLNASTALRQQSFYKIMTGTESGTTVTCMTGSNFSQSRLWVYRPNKAITTVTITSLAQQTTTSAPTAQSKPLSTTSGIFLCFAQHASYASSPIPSSTSTPTRTFEDGLHTMRSFETNYSGITWVDQSISMTDRGTNAMTSFIAQIA